jgi:hypothetical protein
VTGVEDETELVVTGNAAVVAPCGTVTLAPTCAVAVSLLERATTAPPEGAAPFNVTVPVEPLPPMTVVGLSVMEESTTDGVVPP